MRGRLMGGVALGIAATLGGWGCAGTAKRTEAPIQFRQWKGLTGAVSAKEKGDEAFPVTAPATAATTPRLTIWNYRPGSLLFGRKPASTTPATPTAEPAGSLSRYFPGLSGKIYGDPIRLARSTRPEIPPRRSPVVARGSVEPTGNRLAGSSPVSVLPVGLRVETTPKSPPPSLPEGVGLTKQDEEPKASPTASPEALAATSASAGEQLTSHDPAAPSSSDSPSSIDSLSLDLQVEPGPASKTEPAQASVDPASKPAASVVETPAEAPELAVKPQLPPNPPSEAPQPEIKPERATASPVEPVRPTPGDMSSTLPRRSPNADPVLKGRQQLSRVEPMRLPPAEFPATYHSQSLSRVLKENPPADFETQRASATPKEPRRPLFPRLSRLLKPKGEVDPAVKPASNAVNPSTLSEPGQVPEWWKTR